MDKAVMLSIRPEWCAKIAFGEKTVEVRKTRPKIELPFKCYIYETKARMNIIGEFVCYRFFPVSHNYRQYVKLLHDLHLYPCMTDREIENYLGNRNGYIWQITDVVIYDTPRSLSDFGLKRPPQSWCYVQEV